MRSCARQGEGLYVFEEPTPLQVFCIDRKCDQLGCVGVLDHAADAIDTVAKALEEAVEDALVEAAGAELDVLVVVQVGYRLLSD